MEAGHGDGRRATGDGRRATGATARVLFAARSATALHRLLDVLPVFAGDPRVSRHFTLVPGSDFGVDALAAVERAGGRSVPWDEARRHAYDLILAASPKGELRLLRGTRVLLPHGAGFNKTVPSEGSADAASGLDPAYLLPDGGAAVAARHALAHPSQRARLAALSPRAAARATVVGDPTLDRMLASLPLRERYRAALGTGARRLVALSSTWGPESLLVRRPSLPAELAAALPQDDYQLALIVHPNERARTGDFDLAERLAPALDAGLVLPEPYEEWAAVLIAADALVTDHGSAALYFAAAAPGGDRPVLAACDGGEELIPGSPMAELLAGCPRLDDVAGLAAALAGYRSGTGRAAAAAAFAEQGRALDLLRAELYGVLGLTPPAAAPAPRLLPAPAPPIRTPAAFAVRVHVEGDAVRVERFPAAGHVPAHHLAAEFGAAGERQLRGAGLVYRRTAGAGAAPYGVTWTASGWTAHALDAYPGCRTAAAVLSPEHCVVRLRAGGPPLSVRIEPRAEEGRIVRTDPAAVLSAVHARMAPGRSRPTTLTCLVGGLPLSVSLAPATEQELALPL